MKRRAVINVVGFPEALIGAHTPRTRRLSPTRRW
jgi:hypothetical protein